MTDIVETAPALQNRWRGLYDYLAPTLVLVAMAVTFLRYHEYPFLLPESLLLLAGVVVFGVVLGALGRLRPDTLGPAVIALALAAYVFYRPEVTDALFLVADSFSDTKDHAKLALDVIGVGLFLIIFLISIFMRRHLPQIVSAVFGTIAVSTLFLPVTTGGEAKIVGSLPEVRADLPPIIHIILDEHIGLDSLPEEFAESAEAKRAIETTFEGFELYGRAHSRFAETVFSLTSLINGNLGTDVGDFVVDGGFVSTPQRNEWFDVLKRRGYALQVYQSGWFDFCGGPVHVDACYTYPMFSPNVIQRTPLTVGERLRVLAEKVVFGARNLQTSPLAATEALEQFSSDIERAPRGVAYIVHLLLPHHDYFYRDDCTLADPSTWQRDDYGDDGMYSREERSSLYNRYLGQMICADKRMAALFARLKELGIYDEATIIVHGDHGSRNGQVPYMVDSPARYSELDIIDNFATLLAIKEPGRAPGVYEEPVTLQKLFAERFLQGEPMEEGEDILVRGGAERNFAGRDFVWPGAAPASTQEIAAGDVLMELRR